MKERVKKPARVGADYIGEETDRKRERKREIERRTRHYSEGTERKKLGREIGYSKRWKTMEIHKYLKR